MGSGLLCSNSGWEKYEVTVFGLNLKFHKCVVSIQLPVTHKKLLVNVYSGD